MDAELGDIVAEWRGGLVMSEIEREVVVVHPRADETAYDLAVKIEGLGYETELATMHDTQPTDRNRTGDISP